MGDIFRDLQVFEALCSSHYSFDAVILKEIKISGGVDVAKEEGAHILVTGQNHVCLAVLIEDIVILHGLAYS